MSPAASASAPSPAPAANTAPTPYTAEQIREASKAGRTYRWKVETEGKPTISRQVTFAQVETNRALLTTTIEDDKGRVLESDPGKWVTWDELRRHAEFPKDKVTIKKESITVPAGAFACVVYVVQGDKGEIETYWFAENLPGAPVQFMTEKDGKRVRMTTLLEHRAGL